MAVAFQSWAGFQSAAPCSVIDATPYLIVRQGTEACDQNGALQKDISCHVCNHTLTRQALPGPARNSLILACGGGSWDYYFHFSDEATDSGVRQDSRSPTAARDGGGTRKGLTSPERASLARPARALPRRPPLTWPALLCPLLPVHTIALGTPASFSFSNEPLSFTFRPLHMLLPLLGKPPFGAQLHGDLF